MPALSGWANLTWFGWTSANQPLAGQIDWLSLIPGAALAVGTGVVGVELFARRDLGKSINVSWLRLPEPVLGLGSPFSRSFGDRLPLSLSWGMGMGLFGLVVGASEGSFSRTIGQTAQSSLSLFHTLFPHIDLTTAGGFLELTFVEFGFIFAGFAAVTLVSGWAADELYGRIEQLLTSRRPGVLGDLVRSGRHYGARDHDFGYGGGNWSRGRR